ncbi:hypothetical protein GAYE_SCF31G4906 [Galdieria yellowstonensis]|uniref:RING-type domain-containing protein n=1 Tax=Galdieria yellowstonensis TaxID=3028027 RepID=A0AAV9II03_9RHOD|nr:hypothetical protein GAYE_SCF31G4906 [Galdieria yellowstonensis]
MNCIVCLERTVNVCLLPCGHETTCSYCTVLLEDRLCPLCRKPVVQVEIINVHEIASKVYQISEDVVEKNIKKIWCLSCLIESRREYEEMIWTASTQVLLTGSFGLPLLQLQRFLLGKFNPPKTEESSSSKNSKDKERIPFAYSDGRNKPGLNIWKKLQLLCFDSRHAYSSKCQEVATKKPCDCKEYAFEFRSFWGLLQRSEIFKSNIDMSGKRICLVTKYFWEWLRVLQGNERLLPQVIFLAFSEEDSDIYLNEALEMYDLMVSRYRNRFQKRPKIFFLYLRDIHDREQYFCQIQRKIHQRTDSYHLLVSLTIKQVSGKFYFLDSFNLENALRSVA